MVAVAAVSVRPDRLDLRGPRANQGLQVRRGLLVRQGRWGLPVRKGQPALQGHRGRRSLWDLCSMSKPERRRLRGSLSSVPSIRPSTEGQLFACTSTGRTDPVPRGRLAATLVRRLAYSGKPAFGRPFTSRSAFL